MNLALFDLDHTILPLDSDNQWGQFLARTGAIDGVAYNARNNQFYEDYNAGRLNATEYLEFALGTLKGFPRERLNAWHARYMEEIVMPAMHPAGLALVKQHLDAGDLCAIVTATNSFVTSPIAAVFGVEHLIAAQPEYTDDGAMTGRLIGTPTYAAGKVDHTLAWLAGMGKTLADFDKSYFYSDSQNDIPLMSLVTNPVATNPNAKLAAHAQAHGWPILNLFND
jgi:HAD superfamily hydrolase (TIGR01490 family)